MADLWAQRRTDLLKTVEPLAVRMRPRTLDEIAGQSHILAPGKLLRRLLAADALSSLLLHGPPGTGKTTLARVIASESRRAFIQENASSVGVQRIREIISTAERRVTDGGGRTVLFLDEIHRFSRSQQDVLLADVERGLITLIGATTENPLFAVNSALVSRSPLLRLDPLSLADITLVLRRAITDRERGYGSLNLHVDDDALELWATKSDGDARRALTALEVAVLSSGSGGNRAETAGNRHSAIGNREEREGTGDWASGTGEAKDDAARPSSESPRLPIAESRLPLPSARLPIADSRLPSPATSSSSPQIHVTRAIAEDSIQQKAIVYDPTGDGHYDTISAFIKSVRASDPDAALYWLAHMLEAGEDPRFIARRLAILASEDIGNADPRAIMVAASAWELTERLGMPECRITLAQCTTYLALSPKSNASYAAIEAALEDVRKGRSVTVPSHIKDGNVRKAGQLSAGTAKPAESYAYTHDAGIPSPLLGVVGQQDYLGVNARYYHPTAHGSEKLFKDRLEEALRLRTESRGGQDRP
ncbi:MAG: replication-associated recombination protein A [Phycisphaerales bacterium]|nr:replication-associated recombination protein A [Phycisphaerales bacterium]